MCSIRRKIQASGLVAVWGLIGGCAPKQAPGPTQFVQEEAPQSGATAPLDTHTTGRLIILGFDGLDPRQLRRLMAKGQLPQMAALGQRGHHGVLQTTNPPQSPVAWAAFATGSAAGEHGIFDFVGRDKQTYLPKIATTHVEPAQIVGPAITPPSVTNLRRGPAFWDVIARAGVKARALQVPYNYPAPVDGARQLPGLGTPDVRGTNSTFVYLTDDVHKLQAEPPAGGQMVALAAATPAQTPGMRTFRALLEGPRVRIEGSFQAPWLPVTVTEAGPKAVRIEVGGQSVSLKLDETSAYLPLVFVAAPNLKIHATTRVTLRRLAPSPEVYIEPMSLVPEAPYMPLSVPEAYAQRLWAALGPVKTVGWVDDTSGLGAGAMSEAQFLREAQATMAWQRQAILAALDEGDDKLLVAVMTAPDRIAHMFFRAVDLRSLQHRQAKVFADAIDAAYRASDEIVGAVMAKMQPEDSLLVMSDHGFAGFRRGLNINRWLIDHGYMHLRPGARIGRALFADVDWHKTSAYALGTGGIFLNIQGREGQGIVPPALAGKLAQKIARELQMLTDGPIRAVLGTYLGDVLYPGPAREEAPDVRVALADGYRASWGTSLGAAPLGTFETNPKKWSGDHASARPEDVPGVLLSNRPIAIDRPRIEDLARTAYDFCQVPPPGTVIGRSLWAPTNSPGPAAP